MSISGKTVKEQEEPGFRVSRVQSFKGSEFQGFRVAELLLFSLKLKL
jgi:hypothetical protein